MLKFVKKQIANFLTLILVFPFAFFPANSYAVYNGERPVSWNQSESICRTGSLGSDPYTADKDINWELSNPTCASFIALQGALIFTAGIITDYSCIPTSIYGTSKIPAETLLKVGPESPFISPYTLYKLGMRLSLCTGRLSESILASSALSTCMATVAATLGASATMCVPLAAQVTMAASDTTRCCAAYSGYVAAVGAGLAALALLHTVAKNTFEKAKLCGSNWNNWAKVDINGEESATGEYWRRGKYTGSYQKCIESLFIENTNPCGLGQVDGIDVFTVSLRNKYYREYMYGGVEYSDKGGGACKNPSVWTDAQALTALGYSSDGSQRYYMRGPGVASNYACHRFALARGRTAAERAQFQAAYNCCKNRSQNSICIENTLIGSTTYDHKFCQLGDRCNVETVWFDTYQSRTKVNYLCAKTYSVCPYNHLLGGGTEEEVFTLDANGSETSNTANYCQVLKHCTKVPSLPYIRMSNLEGAYISHACRDLKGDAQNVYGLSSEILPFNNRGFSAPLVQCFKETMENLMMNRAGDTLCLNPDEDPDANGVCVGGYRYREGTELPTEESFFIKIQNKLEFAIKMALTLSIVFFGVVILLGMQPITKKQLLIYIVKIGLVMYFALGDAWRFGFVDGILSSSNYLSDVMMRIDTGVTEDRKDGCQFPKFNYADDNPATRFNQPSYPPRKEYLKIWDALDCKFGRAIGFGPEASVPNLIKMIIAGLLTGALGIVFLVATFMFAFFMLSLILRAMHIFLMAITAIIILIYVSPITITLSLFSKTKGIFEGWWKQILGLALQPVILFAYLGIFIALFEKAVVSEARFVGDGRSAPKTVSCGYYRVCKEGFTCSAEELSVANGGTPTPAQELKTNLISVGDNSIYCIFRIADLSTYSGLEPLGIGLPVLTNMNKEKLNTIVKAAFLMFIFSYFMDQISKLAATLVGGSQLNSGASAMAIGKSVYGVARGIQKRGVRGGMKLGKAMGGSGKEKATRFTQGLGERGKSVDNSKDSGENRAGVSEGANRAESNQGDSAAERNPSGGSTGGPSGPNRTET